MASWQAPIALPGVKKEGEAASLSALLNYIKNELGTAFSLLSLRLVSAPSFSLRVAGPSHIEILFGALHTATCACRHAHVPGVLRDHEDARPASALRPHTLQNGACVLLC
jgi:hypothetical protein